uniref:Ig-like domain-containing protein n=1 Tax=Myripristis murdjan TaxID=586833 RepID=A0A667ZE08_9TELE
SKFQTMSDPSLLVLIARNIKQTHSFAVESQVIGPPQPVLSLVGDDVILPCHLEPAMDAVAMTVEWTRPDLKPRFIHVWRDGPDRLIDHHQSYKRRTSLFVDKLRKGDVSLKLSNVRLSDEGKYRCYIPSLDKEAIIDLVVGAASSPVLNVSKSSSGVVLECESKGWYPEPELFWLDAEGKLLSAGAPETVRGPDGLYTVSSRVTVEKSHTDVAFYIKSMLLCFIISGDFFMDTPTADCSCSAEHIVIGFAVVFLCVCVTFFVYKWRQNKLGKSQIYFPSKGCDVNLLSQLFDVYIDMWTPGHKLRS